MTATYVVGAGGIGCALGYALRSAGLDVVFVDANPAKVAWGLQHGVGVDRLPPLPARFQSFADWQPQPGDSIWLCTKCYDNAAVLARLPANVTLIPVQNGFDPALDDNGHAWEGIASFISECTPNQTHTRITRRGRLHLGLRITNAAKEPETIAALRKGLAALSKVRLTEVPQILPYKYTKLLYNAAISPLASAAGIDNGQLVFQPLARRLFFALIQENYQILTGAGLPLGKVGPFHPATVQQILRRPLVSRAFAWAFYPTLRKSYCSMANDLPAGLTEIDYYNRRLIDLAGDRPCPLNRAAYELVKRLERDRAPLGLHHLEVLQQAASCA